MILEGEDHYCGHGVNDMKPIRLAVAVMLFSLSAYGADPNEKLINELRAEYAYLLEETKITPEERTRRRTRGKMSAIAQILVGMDGQDLRAEILREELAASADEDGRTAREARAILLVAACGGASEPEVVRRHAAADLGATCARRVTSTARNSQRTRVAEGRRGRGVAKGPSGFAGTP